MELASQPAPTKPAAHGRNPGPWFGINRCSRCTSNVCPVTVKVLVVDDADQVREMLVQMLELSGFDLVGAASSGAEAVDRIDDYDPDVVVIDYKMPGMDGIATARAIKEKRPGQAMILYTAYLDGQLEREAKAAGVSMCVNKVEGLETLEQDIRRLAGDGL
jgi:DNA-binding NarL/FixJ family response regulator